MTSAVESRCQICTGSELETQAGFSEFCRITSDCRPFRPGGDLVVCRQCGAVQKLPTARWRREIGEIYGQYEAYHQANGDEQIVFDPVEGRPRRRSDVLLDRLGATADMPLAGRMLDIGCGSGATLRAMASRFPGWELYGHELSDRQQARLAAIPGFRRLYTGSLGDIDAKFDFVTMIHAIEHFEEPVAVAATLRRLLAPNGRLMFEVCDIERNPFDILVADHLMHFSPATLRALAMRAGFEVETVATDWVNKEISLVCHGGDSGTVPAAVADAGPTASRRVASFIHWLDAFRQAARASRSAANRFGIFGTSIAGTWLFGELQGDVDFLVDEDESRIGQSYLGKKVLHPREVPAGSDVFLALAPTVAAAIHGRLSSGPVRYILPPELQ